MKTLILVILALSVTPSAFAMPEGSVDCTTPDSKLTVSFEVTNYGEHSVIGLFSLTVDGKDIDVTDKTVVVYRQWMDDKIADFAVSLPTGGLFTRDLKIETTAQDQYSMDFKGTAVVESQTSDYSDPETINESTPIECVYNP